MGRHLKGCDRRRGKAQNVNSLVDRTGSAYTNVPLQLLLGRHLELRRIQRSLALRIKAEPCNLPTSIGSERIFLRGTFRAAKGWRLIG